MARKKLVAPFYFINTKAAGVDFDSSELALWTDKKAFEWNIDVIVTCKENEVAIHRGKTQRLLLAVAISEVSDLEILLQKPARQRPDILIFDEWPALSTLAAVKDRLIHVAVVCENINKILEGDISLVDILLMPCDCYPSLAVGSLRRQYPDLYLVQLSRDYSIRNAITALSGGMSGVALEELAAYPCKEQRSAIQEKLKAVRDYRNVHRFLEDGTIVVEG